MIFGNNLKKYRKAKGLSQKELGDILQLGQTTIANYEKNIRFPNPKILVEIADFFACSLDELVGRGTEEIQPFKEFELIGLKEELQIALLEENEQGVRRIMSALDFSEERIIQLYEKVITYILIDIGVLWEQGKISVAKEHYISGILLTIISGLKNDFRGVNTKDIQNREKKVVLLSLSSEPHTLGIRMITDYFDILGYQTFYLGTNVPTDALKDMIIRNKVDTVAISATMDYHLDSLRNLIHILKNDEDIKKCLNGKLKIVVGGQAIGSSHHGKALGASVYARDFYSLKESLTS